MQNLVVDTSIIISTIIGGRKVRYLFLTSARTHNLHSPAEVIEEIRRNKDKIARLKGIREERVEEMLERMVIPRIKIVPLEEYKDKIHRATRILKDTDPSDAPFIALAIHLNAPLWTGDRGLIALSLQTGEYKALDTRALEMLLEGREWRKVEEYLRERYRARL